MKKNFLISIFLFLCLMAPASFADDTFEATQCYNRAIDLYKQDNISESIDLFKQAISLKSDFYEAYYNLAQILMSENKDEEAYKALEKIIELRPQDTEALYNAGRIQYRRGYLSSSHSYLVKIPANAAQYESAKLLISKIEKRQVELNLEAKIKEHKNTLDAQGKLIGYDIEKVDAPSGVAIDSKGNIFAASFAEDAIYKITIQGQKKSFSKSTLIKGPIGLAIDKNDNVYIANYSGNNLIKITPAGAATIFADIQKPYCLVYDKEHNRLYATEQNTNKIIKFDL